MLSRLGFSLVHLAHCARCRPCRREYLDDLLAAAVGKGLLRLAQDAYARGDVHEFRHLHAAVAVGNSEDCELGDCSLDNQLRDQWAATSTKS